MGNSPFRCSGNRSFPLSPVDLLNVFVAELLHLPLQLLTFAHQLAICLGVRDHLVNEDAYQTRHEADKRSSPLESQPVDRERINRSGEHRDQEGRLIEAGIVERALQDAGITIELIQEKTSATILGGR